jgi:hypothetical protein
MSSITINQPKHYKNKNKKRRKTKPKINEARQEEITL